MSEYIQGFNRKRGGSVNNGDKYYFNIDCSAAGAAVSEGSGVHLHSFRFHGIFFPDRGSFHKDIGPESFGRRREHSASGYSVFYLCRRVYELFRRNQACHGLLQCDDRAYDRRTGPGKCTFVHADGRSVGKQSGRRCHGGEDAGAGDGAPRLFQAVLYCGDSYVIHDYTPDTSGDCHDSLWFHCQYFNR